MINSVVILCSLIRVGSVEWVLAMFHLLDDMARQAGCTNYKIVILWQPAGSRSREADREAYAEALAAVPPETVEILYDEHFVEGQPSCLPWAKLHQYCFDVLLAESVMLVDPNLPDFSPDEREALVPGLVKLIEQARTADFVAGDYIPTVPSDPRYRDRPAAVQAKKMIETLVKEMLSQHFPDLTWRWADWDKLDRPRSEFNAVSSRLYRAVRASQTQLFYDRGLQYLMTALAAGFKVARVELGNVPELYGSGDPGPMLHQISRCQFQIMQLAPLLCNFITNEKLAGLNPNWSRFPGVSVLLDSPDGFAPHSGKTEAMCCSNAKAPIKYYEALRAAVVDLEIDLTQNCLYCKLPFDSYHVTAWDGIAIDGLDRVPETERAAYEQFLQGLPWSLREGLPDVIEPFVAPKDWELTFQFDRIDTRGEALVAFLKPADANSEKALAQLVEYRQMLDVSWQVRRNTPIMYTPHISLAYFPNPDLTARAKRRLKGYVEDIKKAMEGQTLSFRTASLYGFTDMATFFRAHRA